MERCKMNELNKKQYKLSFYNYILPYKNYFVVFNTYSGSLVVLNEEEYKNFNGFNLDAEHFKDCLALGFIVGQEVDECARTQLLISKAMLSSSSPTYRIYTTNDCNARCFYCFEENTDNKYMSYETLDETINFIKRNAQNAVQINICWFGGEPLLNTKVIDRFYSKLAGDKFFASKRMVYSLVTNGSLIDDRIFYKITKLWKIDAIQITLDGTKEIHNYRKNYKNSINGYARSMEALTRLAQTSIRISIRINYDKKNVNNIPHLINEIRKIHGKNINIYTYPLFDFVNSHKDYYSGKQIGKVEIRNRKFLGSASILPIPKRHLCFACNICGFVISPIGDLYKCSSSVGHEEYRIGNVRDINIKYSKAYTDWLPLELPSRCRKCNILPLCMGGCRAKYLNGKNDYCNLVKYTLPFTLSQFVNENFKKEVE